MNTIKTNEEVRAVWDADQKYYETQNGWISENGNDWVDAALDGAVQSVEFSRVSIRLIDGPRHGEIVG